MTLIIFRYYWSKEIYKQLNCKAYSNLINAFQMIVSYVGNLSILGEFAKLVGIYL
jgi:hypothetical protein